MSQFNIGLQAILFVLFVISIVTTFKKHDENESFKLTTLKIIFFVFGFLNLGVAIKGEPTGYPTFSLLLLMLSAAVYVWTYLHTKSKKLTLAFSSDRPTHLYTDGPFAIVRNPFYVSYLLWGLSFVVFNGEIVNFISFAILASLYVVAARYEERKLQTSLGIQYSVYKQCVGGFVPNLSSIARFLSGVEFDHKVKRSGLRQWSPSGFVFLLAFDWACIVVLLIFIAAAESWLLKAIGVALLGVMQHSVAILSHEAVHGFASRSKRLNDFIGNVFCFYPLGVTLEGYREFHLKHHQYAGTNKDPELAVRVSIPSNKGLFYLNTFCDFLGKASLDTFVKVKAILPSNKKHLMGLLAFWAILVSLLFATNNTVLLFYWFLSVYTVFSGILKLREYTEHIGSDSTHVFESNRLIKALLFPHETWCHAEHHENASIPCYSLPVARAISMRKDVGGLGDVVDKVVVSKQGSKEVAIA